MGKLVLSSFQIRTIRPANDNAGRGPQPPMMNDSAIDRLLTDMKKAG